MAGKQPSLPDTSQDVKLQLVGANTFKLPGPYEIGEKYQLLVNVTVTAAHPELLSTTDEGPLTRDVVRMKVDRLVQKK